MKRPLQVADLFCGAGGSSTGARQALAGMGLAMNLVAVNHWDVAVATHAANHPDSAHYCVDVYKTKPREAVPGGKLDLLMASPTCTSHSRARGGKPISWDQRYGRMTPTQVLRWLTDLDVTCLLVENVPEFREWGPVHREAAPLPARCRGGKCKPGKRCALKLGVYFRPWVRRIERLGYRVEHRILNAADHGDATTRQRFFLIARKDGRAITWPAPTHAKAGAGGLRRWRPAREIIDWSLRGRSIFDRPKPLSPKTVARIYAGAVKFGWPEPFLVVLRQHMGARGIDAPLPTITAGGTHIALVQPGPPRHAQGLLFDDPTEPFVMRFGLAEPFVFGNRTNNVAKATEREPVPGITTTTGGGVALVVPQGGGGRARPVEQPMATIATDGAHALVVPYNRTGVARNASEPLPTLTTRDRCGLVMPVTHDDPSCRARDLESPLPSVTAAHRGELAFIAAAWGEREGQAPRVHSVDEPAPTLCAKGRIQLVEGQEEPRVDVLFRMLQPHELAAAMGFCDADTRYEFRGTKEEVTRQIGNAVPVRTASALVRAIFAGAAARAEVA